MPSSDHGNSWYALRTFHAQEYKVSLHLERHHVDHFIPMVNHSYRKEDGTWVKAERPAVHNLLFVRKTGSRAELRSILAECDYPVSVYHHIDDEQQWYEISDNELLELRLLCDKAFSPQFISQEESELKMGTEVCVKHGPFKGITGKLVRKNKKYYLVKTFVGLGVMVSVSRWCCEAVRRTEQ